MNSVNYNYKNLAHNAHSVGISEYHLEWCTKYRYETLRKEQHYIDCERIIRNVAERHKIDIIEIGVMQDHVHVVVNLPPGMSPSHAARLLKGGSSYQMFREHPNFRKRYWNGHFWSRSYFYRSVSNVNEDVIRKYVREDNTQRQKHLFN